MSIWNKVLLGLIFLASIAFMYMAARTLKTHEYWRNVAQAYEYFIEVRQQYSAACENGGELALMPKDAGEEWAEDNELRQVVNTGKVDLEALKRQVQVIEETPGVRQLKFDLSVVTKERGRVWFQCEPQGAQQGVIRVNTSSPDPNNLTKNELLQVFEEIPLERVGGQVQGGRYLGEFAVTEANPDEGWVDLKPTKLLPPSQQQAIDASVAARTPWTLYSKMPVDGHRVFAGMDEAQLAALMPPATLPEYVHDGQEATEADLQQWGVEGEIVDGKYVRPLRDYLIRFNTYEQQRPLLADLIESATRDKQYVEAAQKEAEQEVAFRKAQETELEAQLAEVDQERKAAEAHLARLEAMIKQFETEITRLAAANQATAGKIAQQRLEEAKRIDERTRRMARASNSN